MKLLKLAVIALFTLGIVSNANAQDENNPIAVGFGVNVIDLSDYPGSTQNWNFLGSLSRVSFDKYLEKGFTLQFAAITVNNLRLKLDLLMLTIMLSKWKKLYTGQLT